MCNSNPLRIAAVALVLLSLSACSDDPAITEGSGKSYVINPGPNATAEMIAAMVTVIPGDTIEFGCGFFNLTSSLQLSNTEAITIKGCGIDKTVLSFRGSNLPVGILAVNVRGLLIKDLTVADSSGNGFELRGVDHGTLTRVRAYWSSGGGKEAKEIRGEEIVFVGITEENYTDGRLKVSCTKPATLNPNAPENEGHPESISPDYTVSDKAGRYGIYPVSSDNILIEYTESIGASDAGIYVGQTNNTIIRNSRAAFNVFGFEIENVQGGEYYDNVAECNTGGFLIYDLDGNLRQYGDRTRMYRNISRKNNTYNFTENGFVSNVPRGSGMITLAYDRIDIFDNEFSDNDTAGIIHTSYELFPEGGGRPTEKRIDMYTEGVHIFRNTFRNNGNNLPEANSSDMQNEKVERLLPAIIGYKIEAACKQAQNAAICAAAANPNYPRANSGFRGGHILFDGLIDPLDEGCAYPKRPDGSDVPADARGKPQHTNQENPTCHYNAYKFDTAAQGKPRKLPDWWFSCIDDDNIFSTDSLAFANFRGLKGANAAVAVASGKSPTPQQLVELQEFPALFDQTPHKCVSKYGSNLPLLDPIIFPPFVPSNTIDTLPTAEEIEALCGTIMPPGKVNFEAVRVNCPRLDQYNLFSNPQDPRSAPNKSDPGGNKDTDVPGIPFVLNTKLFSDYSVKYRVLFMPTGGKAIYKDAAEGGDNATMIFPVGTVIAKTFAFVTDQAAGTEIPIETRLLVKRVNSKTRAARWDGLAYIWSTEDGKQVARLSPSGGQAEVSWNFRDVDSGLLQQGSTNYQIPNSNQCLSCHSREDSEAGSAPIGMKIRNLNRPYLSESPITSGQANHAIKGKNQIEYLCTTTKLMLGCPADLGVNAGTKIAANIERLPIFNKVGDGHPTNTNADIEARARAYLEVNCQHCHNVRGFAASTGLYFDYSAPVGLAYGICKKPTATGAEGSSGRPVDIFPADPSRSILEFRLSSAATTPAARMPPLARSVAHGEGHALIQQWIRDVIKVDTAKYPNSDACGN